MSMVTVCGRLAPRSPPDTLARHGRGASPRRLNPIELFFGFIKRRAQGLSLQDLPIDELVRAILVLRCATCCCHHV